MYQGRSAASARAADDRHASRQPAPADRQPAPAKPALPGTGRRRLELAPVPESARAAREFTVATLHEWRLEPLTEDAVVVASELTTNAIRHGTPAGAGDDANDPGRVRVELSWCLQASRLICVVTDHTGTPPAVAAQDPEAESGHGLQIVGALAVAWGWTMLGTGEKAVWAALDLPGQAGAAADSAPALELPGHADAVTGSAPAPPAASVLAAAAAGADRTASPAAARDMRAAGRAADPGRRDPSPAAPLCPAAGWRRRCGAGAAVARS
jgi:Histidine kinase-like ATPase domain